jgi:oligopeptide transport system substrate-binding protein
MTKLLRRQWLLSLVAIFAVFAFAAACGDDDDGGNGDGGAAKGGTITAATLQFETWDPHFSDFSQDISHFYKVWRGLYFFDNDGKPIPSMADGMPQVSQDGKTYTVKLKPNLKWSDDQPLTAEDFVLGMLRSCNPDVASHYQYVLTAVVGCDDYYTERESAQKKEENKAKVGVRAIDATTIEYKLTDAQPTFTIILGMWPTFPVPKHIVTAVDQAWPGPLQNVYNGPFMPSAYTEKDRMELVPNPNWSGKKPNVDKIILRYIDDSAVAEDAYRAGEIDVTLANSANLDATKRDPVLSKELFSAASPTTIALEFNMKDPVFSKLEVRLALSQATDRETLSNVVLKGANTPTTHWIPAERAGTQQGVYDAILGFNVAKAKENMSKAGFPDGRGFPGFTLLLRDSATNKLVGEFLQQQWKTHLGIDIKLEFVDSPTRSGRFNRMEYQMVTGGWHEDYPDPENWMLGLMETNGSINKTGTSHPQIDDLLSKAKFNTNDEQRRQQYRDAEKILLENALGYAPIWHTVNHFLVKPHIKGMIENSTLNDSYAPGDWQPENWSTTKK